MPSASPVPRGPSVLALGSAAELFTRPGCPVCRYAAEASDRYLAWFALEAHADPVTITRWWASLGTCAMHTRRLMGQPGAAARLTAGYRYVLQAARAQLAGRGTRLATCLACEHDEAAARRTLEVLLDGLAETGVRGRYMELGGLCVPHMRAACRVRGHRHATAWVVQSMAASTTDHRSSLDLLAGGPDYDADERARLRAALPPAGRLPAGACLVCLMAARAELADLVRAAGSGGGRRPEGAAGDASRQGLCLCAGHLRDAALMGGGQVAALLARQAEVQAAGLARLVRPPLWRRGGNPAGWLRAGHPGALDDECPVCQARERAAWQELQRCRAVPQAAPARWGAQMLCVRHVLALRAADPVAGRATAALAAERAGRLIEELAEAFRKGTWAFRHESRGPEANAWRRAVAFLDGCVFGGRPPPEQP
jgi:hypothetical protein